MAEGFWAVESVGDLASICGLVLALVGFASTITVAMQSKSASKSAAASARRAADRLAYVDAVVELSKVSEMAETIKQLQREKQWAKLPEKLSAVRRLLIRVKTDNPNISAEQKTVIQSAISQFSLLETKAEKAASGGKESSPATLNGLVVCEMDQLEQVLNELKRGEGQSNVAR